ncbi:MAG TPA: transcription antitermination factor NusB [Vicinamibacterales bacterium]|nr:transcription antitermination factor NusB [Vicinamibacterales bacterium]
MTSQGERWEGRRRSREAALRMLYQTEVGQSSVIEVTHIHGAIGGDDAIELDDTERAFAVALAQGAWQDRDVLDGYIGDAARNWRVERLAVVDRLLLRLAVHELVSHQGTPPRVVIDEAIELAREYSGDEAAKFVNGVLDGVFKRLKDEGKVIE